MLLGQTSWDCCSYSPVTDMLNCTHICVTRCMSERGFSDIYVKTHWTTWVWKLKTLYFGQQKRVDFAQSLQLKSFALVGQTVKSSCCGLMSVEEKIIILQFLEARFCMTLASKITDTYKNVDRSVIFSPFFSSLSTTGRFSETQEDLNYCKTTVMSFFWYRETQLLGAQRLQVWKLIQTCSFNNTTTTTLKQSVFVCLTCWEKRCCVWIS